MIQRLEVQIEAEADDNLFEIWMFIVESSGNEKIADTFIERIRERCFRIGDIPRQGKPRDDLYQGLRTIPFERSAVIAYLIDGDMVRITNIFYGGRDFEALFGSELVTS